MLEGGGSHLSAPSVRCPCTIADRVPVAPPNTSMVTNQYICISIIKQLVTKQISRTHVTIIQCNHFNH